MTDYEQRIVDAVEDLPRSDLNRLLTETIALYDEYRELHDYTRSRPPMPRLTTP